ncbi:MAG: hypothetical protein AAF267_01395 [Deinococcota bacterium]
MTTGLPAAVRRQFYQLAETPQLDHETYLDACEQILAGEQVFDVRRASDGKYIRVWRLTDADQQAS